MSLTDADTIDDLNHQIKQLEAEIDEMQSDHKNEIEALKKDLAEVTEERDANDKVAGEAELKIEAERDANDKVTGEAELKIEAAEDRAQAAEDLLRTTLDVIYRETGISDFELAEVASHVDPVRALHRMGYGRAKADVRLARSRQ